MKLSRYLLVFTIAIIGISFGDVNSQAVTGKTLRPYREVTRDVNNLIRSAENKSIKEKLSVIARGSDMLRPYGSTNRDIAVGVRLIDIDLKRREFLRDTLMTSIDRVRRSRNRTVRNGELYNLRGKLIDRANYLVMRTDPKKITVSDAKNLAAIVTYLQAGDDIRNNSLTGSGRSQVTRVATLIGGIVNLGQGVEDRDARRIMSGIRTSAGILIPTNASLPLGMPGDVSSAMNDVTLQGWQETTGALENISDAINGDAQALERVNEYAGRLERTLSGENYGRAMANAIANSVLGKIPLWGALKRWFFDKDDEDPKNIKVGLFCSGISNMPLVRSISAYVYIFRGKNRGKYIGNIKINFEIEQTNWRYDRRSIITESKSVETDDSGYVRFNYPYAEGKRHGKIQAWILYSGKRIQNNSFCQW